MKIELQFNSFQIDQQELQEQFPGLLSALHSYLPTQKTPKRRRPRKKRITAGQLIDRIIADIEQD